jgi:hypothetical protein
MEATMSTTTYVFDSKIALEQFKKRKAANSGKQIDNSSLYAGSPMVYYCKFCGEHTQTLPESHIEAPKVVCDACKILRDHGLVDARGNVVE